MRRARAVFPRGFSVGLVLFLAALGAGCAPSLLEPVETQSALVIGRVVINYRRATALGVAPPGVIKEGILVELFSQDARTIVRVTTDEEGYFFLPNIPSGVYDVAQVSFGNIAIGWRGSYMSRVERFSIPAGTLAFTPAPGKVGYAGGIILDVDERGFGTAGEASDYAGAREYFLRNWAKSPWAAREVISLRARPAARPISHF